MAFTQTHLDAVEEAIIKLSTGTKAVSITVSGKTLTYQQNRLQDLLSLRSIIHRELGITPSTVYTKNMGRTRT